MRIFKWSPCVLAVIVLMNYAHASQVSGMVYHDKNLNGMHDEGEPGIPDVALSNGEAVVVTDATGRYIIDVPDPGIVFLIKPQGWMPPMDPVTGSPQFYYLHRAEGSPPLKYGGIRPTGPLPEQVNFALHPQDEKGPVRMLVLGDTQPRDFTEVHYFAQDMVAEVAGMDFNFGFTLGDNVFDDLSVFEPLVHAVGKMGVPWHYVPGNHDMDFDAPTWEQAFETFQQWLGPSYYAFAVNNVHVFVLNNIRLKVGEGNYHAELGDVQRAFIRNYLDLVPRDAFVLFLMHIPIMDLADKAAFFELIAPYSNCISFSAHWHRHQHFFLGPDDGWPGEKPHHHVVQGTACGAWYRGFHDAVGIPEAVQADGSPKGYGILTVDGTNYDLLYRATRRPETYQMDIHAPREVAPGIDAQGRQVVVNFFNGTRHCSLEMRLNDGPWQSMEQFEGKAPYYLELTERQNEFVKLVAQGRGIEELDDQIIRLIETQFRPAIGYGMPGPADTNHLWRATLPETFEAGYNLIEVRAKDMFGREHHARRYAYFNATP